MQPDNGGTSSDPHFQSKYVDGVYKMWSLINLGCIYGSVAYHVAFVMTMCIEGEGLWLNSRMAGVGRWFSKLDPNFEAQEQRQPPIVGYQAQ